MQPLRMCSPTRAAVLTGRTNDRTGVFRVGDPINKQEKMLSTAFQQAGYSTAHFGKWHLNGSNIPGHQIPASDPLSPGELGFDYWLSISTQFNLEPGAEPKRRPGTFRRRRFRGDRRRSARIHHSGNQEGPPGVRGGLVLDATPRLRGDRGGCCPLSGSDRQDLRTATRRIGGHGSFHRHPAARASRSWNCGEHARLVH